jgi:hypothetical protein
MNNNDTPSELHRIVRSTFFPQSRETNDGAAFFVVLEHFSSLELPLDECPQHFKQGQKCALMVK